MTRTFEPTLLALQANENLLLPALPYPLDPHGRKVHCHPVLEARAEESVHVRMSGSALPAVLMDGEDALGASDGAAKGLLDGVTENALAEVAVQLPEALGRGVVYGENEAEVDGTPEPARVLAEGLSDGWFISPHGAEALADSVELTPVPVGQSLLAVGDVAHLRADSTRVSVIASLDEEHVRPPRPRAPSGAWRGLVLLRRRPAPTRRR
jgi:hypothetical protein